MSSDDDNSARCCFSLPKSRLYSLAPTRSIVLYAIIKFISPTLVQFLSTSTTSRAMWTTLEKTYVSPSRKQIMVHCQNLASPQQGTWTITEYMQYVKHNIDSLALMNVPVDFNELYVCVLNGLGSAYSNLFHALQVWETPITFEELFKHLLNYEAQLRHSVPLALLAFIRTTDMVTLPGSSFQCQLNNRGSRNPNRSLQS